MVLEQQLVYKNQRSRDIIFKKNCIFRPGWQGMITVAAHIKYQIINEMLAQEDNLLNITWLCKNAGVPRSGYHHYPATEEIRLRREK